MSYETSTPSAGQVIATQIGQRAFAMMGARNLLAGQAELQFAIGRNAKGVTHVRVTLTAADLYDVTFYRIGRRGLKVSEVARAEGIFADQLRPVIEAETGLYLSL